MEFDAYLKSHNLVLALSSFGVYPYMVSTILAKSLIQKKIGIFTWSVEKTEELIKSMKLEDRVSVWKVGDNPKGTVDTIIIDTLDSTRFIDINSGLKNGIDVVVIASENDDSSIETLRKNPSLGIVNLSFLDAGKNIKYNNIEVSMTPRQLYKYRIRNLYENSIKSNGKLRITNITYPADLQAAIDVLEERERIARDGSIPCFSIDTLSCMATENLYFSGHEMVKNYGYRNMTLDAPKLRSLFSYLNLNSEMRHLIFTSFDDLYGASLIFSLGIELKLPLFLVTGKMSSMEIDLEIKRFNATDGGILVISTAPTQPLNNVGALHFIDNPGDIGYEILSNIYKYGNYGKGLPKLDLNFYSTYMVDNMITIDTQTQNIFQKRLRERELNFESLILMSQKATLSAIGSVIIGDNTDNTVGVMAE